MTLSLSHTLAAAALAASLAGCSQPPAAPAKPAPAAQQPAPASAAGLPAGSYRLDPAHASLTFQVDHLGFSHYTARFTRFDATLQLDPAHPETAKVEATIQPASLALNTPPPGFQAEITGPNWLDAAKFPTIGFRSTAVQPTGPDTAHITGDLSLHGVTRPVTLKARFNGGWPGMAMDPHARIGFSAKGSFDRAPFGVASGVPAAGSKMGVSDAVDFAIEAEFTGPAWTPPKTP